LLGAAVVAEFGTFGDFLPAIGTKHKPPPQSGTVLILNGNTQTGGKMFRADRENWLEG
jgi:hypothetical protein